MSPSTMVTLASPRRVSPSARTQAESTSTPTTLAARWASSRVSTPRPGPTSTTCSAGRTARAATSRSRWPRSARKFWPHRRWNCTPKRRATARIVDGLARSGGSAIESEQLDGIAPGGGGYGFDAVPAEGGDALNGLGQVARRGGLAAAALGWKERRVGLHRLAQLLAQAQHLSKRAGLRFGRHPVVLGEGVVQANLAHGDHPRMRRQGSQRSQLLGL